MNIVSDVTYACSTWQSKLS